MEHNFNSRIIEPRLYSCDNIIIKVNTAFINLTGFTKNELLGKSMIELGYMLKFDFEKIINNEYSGYIFTNLLKAREVNIALFYDKVKSEKIFTFVLKSNSILVDNLTFVEQLFNDSISGVAVYSVPGLILLKANQKYLDLLNSPFNKKDNTIGRPIIEIATGFMGTKSEIIFNTVLETQKINYTLDSKQIPIFEDKNMKYIIDTTIDVDKSVLKNQSLEQQLEQEKEKSKQQAEKLEEKNMQLMSIIENLSEGIIISDNKSKIIMTNSESKRLVYQSDKAITVGDFHKNTKTFDMEDNEIPLKDFPQARALKGEKVKNAKMLISSPDREYYVEISSLPIYDTNGDLSLVATCFHDITETIEQSKKIQEQKKELESIIENIADGISVFDCNGQYILLNKSEREMFSPFYESMVNTKDWHKLSKLYDIDGVQLDAKNVPSCRVMRGESFKNMRISIKFQHKTIQINVSGTPIYDN